MIEVHVCYAGDVIEGAPPAPPKKESGFNLRDEAMSLWSITRFAQKFFRGFKKIETAEMMLYYACEVTSGRRKTPVNIPEMIEKWKACIVVLCTAHDKAAIDQAEFGMDELLKPMLTAPVAQIREFYAGLLTALQADERIPFFVWSIFKNWGEYVLEKAYKDAPPRRLKRKLAERVAKLSMTKQTRTDMVQALVGALMWRSPEALKDIERDIKDGAKPRVKGRESCIFLVTEGKRGEHTVML